jgi:hypothetical protein
VASYHFRVQVFGRADGYSALAAAAYRAGERLVDDCTGQVHDYRRRSGVVHSEIMLPQGAAPRLGQRQQLWNAVEQAERRRDAQLYRSVTMALPSELDASQRVKLVRRFVHDQFVGKGRGRDTPLGSWNAKQNRSYFAVHIKDNWWVWGYDSQLNEDIDKPQAEYFTEVARQMPPGSKVILCASVPTWLKAELSEPNPSKRQEFYRALDYIANIVRNECTNSRIPLVLSGDLHHYSRYRSERSGTNFITAGGGGAFLHPTHHLPDEITLSWAHSAEKIKLGGDLEEGAEACYPRRADSKKLVHGNLLFAIKNYDFCWTLGAIYSVSALLLLWWSGYPNLPSSSGLISNAWYQLSSIATTPIFLVIAVVYWMAITKYADIKPKKLKIKIGTLHSLIHILIMTIGVSFFSSLSAFFLSLPLIGEIAYFGALVIGMTLTGFLGGFVWGLYLMLVSHVWALHTNDAFSAMRLDSYRHFLRMKIEGDTLTIFPIGIDKSPCRSVWRFNDERDGNDQDAPILVPKHTLEQRLIEGPIVIDATQMPLLSERP